MKAKDSGLEIIKFEGDPQKFKNAKTRNINLVFHKRIGLIRIGLQV